MKHGRNTCLNCWRPVGTLAGGWPALCKHNCLETHPPKQFFNGMFVGRTPRITASRPRPRR